MSAQSNITRRRLLQGASTLIAAPAVLRLRSASAAGVFKIGMVSPLTGPLAAFGETQDFIVAGIQPALKALTNNGKPVEIQLIHKDSQSNPNRASEVASELILKEQVNLIITKDAPETINPVADQAELNGVPCISTVCPWQNYFFGRKGDPAKGFEWTYHFFWGLEDIGATFIDIWDQSGVAKRVGGLYANDADGNANIDPKSGMPPVLAAAGYQMTLPGLYEPMANDYTAQISAFKKANCEILTAVMLPPEFATFWSQAAQQGYRPKVATIAKALLFPSTVHALGDRGDGLTVEVAWTPEFPFASSLTGQSARQLADSYMKATGRPWTVALGFGHALFELALDAVKRTADLTDPKAVLAAVASTNLKTIAGPVKWGGGPVKNVSKTPILGGQWQKQGTSLDLITITNTQHPEIPVGGKLQLLS